MKNTKFLIQVVSLLLPFQAFSADVTVCTKDKLERRVEVASTDSTKTVPCEVRYFKDSTSEPSVLWTAKNKAEYCQAKAKEFIEKLGTFGWTCGSGSTAAATTPPAETSKTTSHQKTEIKETAKDVKTPEQTNPKADVKTPAATTAPASTIEKKK